MNKPLGQLVMTLVVRIERGSAPRQVDALEAAAETVLRLEALRRHRSDAEALWTAWEGSPRKVVRRARAGHWSEAVAKAQVRVLRGASEVLGFAPHRIDETPGFLRRLQVQGTHVPDDTDLRADPPPEVPVLWLSPEVSMTTGKAMAQVGHAAAQLWSGLTRAQQGDWAGSGFPLAVRESAGRRWVHLNESGEFQVRDGGLTEIPRGTVTVISEWRSPDLGTS